MWELVSPPSRRARPQAALTCGASFSTGKVLCVAGWPTAGGAGDSHIREGETAGVKGTFWPWVKSVQLREQVKVEVFQKASTYTNCVPTEILVYF